MLLLPSTLLSPPYLETVTSERVVALLSALIQDVLLGASWHGIVAGCLPVVLLILSHKMEARQPPPPRGTHHAPLEGRSVGSPSEIPSSGTLPHHMHKLFFAPCR
jgi:hypothetical protein